MQFLILSVTTLLMLGCGSAKDLKQERTTYGDFYDADAQNGGEGIGQEQGNNSGNNTNKDIIDDSPTNDDELVPDDQFDPGLKLRGEIQDVTAKGEVYGWAVYPDDPTLLLTVDVYLNGDATTGDFLGSFAANQEGFDNGFEGNHAFRAQIPTNFRDGQVREITAFAEVDGNMEAVFSKQFTFRAFSPTTEGQNYYNNTLRPLLQNSCGGCHGNRAPVVTYNAQYEYILSPNPAKTGTADNNVLINKASGGMNHGGNNRCGANGKNGSPCAEIQTWWQMEFGAE